MSQNFQRVDNLAQVPDRKPTMLAIGVFDGVHLGHQDLLQTMAAKAQREGARSAVLTFFPHPLEVIQDITGRIYLTTLERRVRLLAAQGIELVIVHPFDEKVRKTRAADFVDSLCRVLDLRQLWGGSFSLGYQREGDADFLRRLGEERGFTVNEISNLVSWDGAPVSSSRIRRALSDGDIATVNGCLNRRFAVGGEVVRGDQRGRTIGFPTANLAVWDRQLLPAYGVYAGRAWLEQEPFAAAVNVGVRPTVADPRLVVEAYLLDFDRDIYGQELKVEFVSRIRDEQKFSGLDALKRQIHADVEQVRQLL